MIIEGAFLDRWRYEWIAPFPADEGVHFLSAPAFQTENAESCERHELEFCQTFSQFKT
jgi:hypothetical protein